MTGSGHTVLATAFKRLVEFATSLSRYDLLLIVIPAVFVFSLVVGYFLSVPPQSALAAASVVGALVLADGLFLNPPRDRGV